MGKKIRNEKVSEHTPSFEIVKIPKGLKNGEVHSKPKRLPVCPPHLPQLPLLIGGFGVVRSGKTNAFTNLIQEYCNYGSINALYCISPTYDSNTTLQTLPFLPEHIYTDSRQGVQSLRTILDDIKSKVEEWEYEKNYKRIYKLWKNKQIFKMTYDDMTILQRESYRTPKSIPWPCPAIFLDDMTHTELMQSSINNELSHLCLHHRHLHGVGVSIFQAFQTFKSGMPKVVRSNLGGIMLFPTCNMDEIKDIYTEVSNNITFETFKRLLFEATKEKHSFLFINKMEKDETRQFGINFDEKFIIDPVEERRKLLDVALPKSKKEKDTEGDNETEMFNYSHK